MHLGSADKHQKHSEARRPQYQPQQLHMEDHADQEVSHAKASKASTSIDAHESRLQYQDRWPSPSGSLQI